MADQQSVRSMTIADLESAIILKFSCPTCDKYIYPPIGQCLRGHTFCPKCFNRMNRCPFCLQKKSKSRCIVLEKLNNMLQFPCRFASKGCTFTSKSNAIADHEVHCEHSVSVCPLRLYSCEWSGRHAELMTHCLKTHPRNIYRTSSQELLVEKFNDLEDRQYFILFNVYDSWFRFTWSLDSNTRTLLFAMHRLGTKPTQMKFGYEVKFVHPTEPGNEIVLMDFCQRLEDHSVILMPDKPISADYDVLTYYCDEAGDLSYNVNIFRKTVCFQHASVS